MQSSRRKKSRKGKRSKKKYGEEKKKSDEEKYFDLGAYCVKISTQSKMAQEWFNRGIRWTYGFNHEEATRCFREGLKHDPLCAMLSWGIGYANGTNYNNPTLLDGKLAYDASRQALLVADENITKSEQLLIEALAKRYKWPLIDAMENPQLAKAQQDELARKYSDAMALAYQENKNSTDVAFWYAESLMNLRPWKLWEKDEKTGKIPANTLLIVEILEEHLKREPMHPGLCHMYVHAMELSPSPEKALSVADRLFHNGGLVPASGHLIHMASHIDMWVGQYARAVEGNRLAFEADERYVKVSKHDGGIYLAYRMHNLHFLVWAAMFDGQYETARKYSLEIKKQLSEDKLEESGMAVYLEGFVLTYLMVLTRFGRWKEILAEPIPKNSKVFPALIAATHYARGVAYSAMGNVKRALEEEKIFLTCIQSDLVQNRVLHNNIFYHREGTVGIFNVGEMLLRGEILYRQGRYVEAFKALREAVVRDDDLNYDEPWGWMQPCRHALGALLTEQKCFKEAKEVFETDLKKWKRNLWSLKGLATCEKALGNKKRALQLESEFKVAAKRLDVGIGAACACAINGTKNICRR